MCKKNIHVAVNKFFLIRIDQNKPKIIFFFINPCIHTKPHKPSLCCCSESSFGMSKCIWKAKLDFFYRKKIFFSSVSRANWNCILEDLKKLECWRWHEKKLFMEFFLTREWLQIIYHSGLKCTRNRFDKI